MNLNKVSYSVVIATLGEYHLSNTLKCIYNSTVTPNEIIVCLPPNQKINQKIHKKSYVKVINSDLRGQVNQRIYGLRLAVSDYVLQLDDDVLFENNMIQDLINVLIQNNNVCCAPFFLKKNSSLPFYTNSNSFFKNLIYNFSLINYQGKISKTGMSYGVCETKSNMIEVDWLPGACIFHHKKNLILDNYFPFNGKAYYEDILHSKKIKELNVKLLLVSNAKLFVDDPSEEIIKQEVFKNKFRAFKIKKYVFKQYKISNYYYYWTTLIELLSSFKHKF